MCESAEGSATSMRCGFDRQKKIKENVDEKEKKKTGARAGASAPGSQYGVETTQTAEHLAQIFLTEAQCSASNLTDIVSRPHACRRPPKNAFHESHFIVSS